MNLLPPINLLSPPSTFLYDIEVQWDPNPDGDFATLYNLQYRPQGTIDWQVDRYLAPLDRTETLYGSITAMAATTYEWQVQATNDDGDTSTWTESHFDTSLSDTVDGKAGVGQIWMSDIFLDFRNPAVRGKFVNPDGSWRNVGLYGEVPTGESPIVFMRVGPDDIPDDFPDNYGDGGNWYWNYWGDNPDTGVPYLDDMQFDLCVAVPTLVTSLLMLDLKIIEFPPDQPLVHLRYSDDAGASWSNKLEEYLGREGEFSNNLQWNRLGTARFRVWEISWSTPTLTALTGVFIDLGHAQS